MDYCQVATASEIGKKRLLGEILVESGRLTPEQLEEALTLQKTTGGRLGWILMSQGIISRLDLFHSLAAHFQLSFWNLDFTEFEQQFDCSLMKRVPHKELINNHGIPVKLQGDRLTLLTDFPENERCLEFFRRKFSVADIEQWVITDLDLIRIVDHYYRETLIDASIYGLFYRNPEESALRVFTTSQIVAMGCLLLAGLVWLYVDAVSLLIFIFLLMQMFYFVTVAFRLLLSLVGARCEVSEPITPEDIAALDDKDLPPYSVLIPVYREPEVLPTLIDSLKKIDYPPNKLDVLLLLEENDQLTLEAAKKAQPPGNWRFVIIPDTFPKTKPKACNYGVYFCRGTYLTIYDAEDIPEPDQLKKAVAAFNKHGDSHLCFQAALNYFNANENFITRLFTLEYSYWFDYLLPGLDRLQLPIPLGGTSNHFQVKHLKALGAWDPFNVTEDADLGIRGSANGLTVGVINSTTYEEANSRYGNWIRQRSRWIKGYIQTALVFNRHPWELLKKLGIKKWLAFQLFIGGTPVTFLINPIVWAIFLYWLATQSKVLDPLFPPLLTYLGLYNLIIGNFMGIYLNMMAVFRRKLYGHVPYALLNPLYWLFFHSVAAYKALWQLFSKPFYWEKTTHGISRMPKPVH
ncbi:MAG: glycosyltransferase [Deltaproteobacteria bacterium]|nr:glycosyltransferase [Deltaproteobacteria bacterium]